MEDKLHGKGGRTPETSGFEGLKSVCLFGGTFDPIHVGHMVIAQRALEFCDAQRLIMLPACSPPHKNKAGGSPSASFDHRLRMAAIAVSSDPRFDVSDLEARRPGASYTVDLLREIRAQMHPDADVCFLVGADWVSKLSTWKDIDLLFGLCRFIVAPRPGYSMGDVRIAARELGAQRAAALQRSWIPAPEIGISSTEIRERIASGLDVRYLLPAGVEDYIRANGLYGALQQVG